MVGLTLQYYIFWGSQTENKFRLEAENVNEAKAKCLGFFPPDLRKYFPAYLEGNKGSVDSAFHYQFYSTLKMYMV